MTTATKARKSVADFLYPRCGEYLPRGKSGSFDVRSISISDSDVRMETMKHGRGSTPAGNYTALYGNGTLWMSDTADEMRDHYNAVSEGFNGSGERHLVTGLGLGLIVRALLRSTDGAVTVIERAPDVIALVGPTLRAEFGDRIEIIEADAMAWLPPKGVKYGVVWHDIWPALCTDNLADMAVLRRRYGRRSRWCDCWGRHHLLYRREQERRSGW